MKKVIAASSVETQVNLEAIIEEANVGKIIKRTLNDTEALKLIISEFDSVSSKNGMLKHIRGLGFSIAMSRVFKLYDAFKKTLKVETNEEPSEEVQVA